MDETVSGSCLVAAGFEISGVEPSDSDTVLVSAQDNSLTHSQCSCGCELIYVSEYGHQCVDYCVEKLICDLFQGNTECRGRSGSTSASYSAGLGFRFRPRDRSS